MNGEGTCDGVSSSERRVEFRVKKNGRKDKVITERSAAEGLPQGWIKELVMTRKAGKLRKDPFFIDPESGYIFFSLKDASRYVRTGVIGNLARKPKENSHDEDDSESAKTLSLSGSEEERSPENSPEKEKKINIYVRNSKRRSISSLNEHSENSNKGSKPSTTRSRVLQEEAREKQHKQDPMESELIPLGENDTTTPNARVEKRVTRSQAKAKKNDDSHELGRENPSSSAKSEDCNVSSKLKIVSFETPEEGLVEKKETQDSTKRKPVSCSGNVTTSTPEKQAVERRVTRSQAKVMNDDSCELKRKTELISDGLPRQASKRQAGTELEPAPELKSRIRAQQVPIAVPSDNARAEKFEELVPRGKPAPDSCETTVTPLSQAVIKENEEHSSPKQDAALGHCKKTDSPLVSEKNNELVETKPEGHSGDTKRNISYGRKNKKTGPPRVSARGCQTAVAKFEETSKPVDAPQVPGLSFQAVATKRDEKTTCGKSGRSLQSKPNAVPNQDVFRCQTRNEIPLGTWNNLACVAPTGSSAAVKGPCSVLSEKRIGGVSEPLALDSTLADLWKDPCIAFAIKTLTGESLDSPYAGEILTEHKRSDAAYNHEEQRGVTFFPAMPESSGVSSNPRPGYSTESPATDIWKDPCIDFAIKTLTGAIPIGFDEPEGHSKPQPTATAPSTQAPEGRQSYRDQDRNKAVPSGAGVPQQVGTSSSLRFSSSFSEGFRF